MWVLWAVLAVVCWCATVAFVITPAAATSYVVELLVMFGLELVFGWKLWAPTVLIAALCERWSTTRPSAHMLWYLGLAVPSVALLLAILLSLVNPEFLVPSLVAGSAGSVVLVYLVRSASRR